MSNIPITAVGNKCGVRPVDQPHDAAKSYNIIKINDQFCEARFNGWFPERTGVEIIEILPVNTTVIISSSKQKPQPIRGTWRKDLFVKIRAEKVDGSGFVEGWVFANNLHKMREI